MSKNNIVQIQRSSYIGMLLVALPGLLALIAAATLSHDNSVLRTIRLQQYFGFISIGILQLILLLPTLEIFLGKQKLIKLYEHRRLLGLSVFFYAALHTYIVMWKQFGGIESVRYLPLAFQQSLLLATYALFHLYIMSVTSISSIRRLLGANIWRYIHKLVYITNIIILLHIWMIGTHSNNPVFLLLVHGSLLLIGFGAVYRCVDRISKKNTHIAEIKQALLILSMLALFSLIQYTPSLIQNYHAKHIDPQAQGNGH